MLIYESISLSHLLGSVEGVPLVDVVVAVDHPEDYVVGVDDAARIVCLPVRVGGVAQVKLIVTIKTNSVK